MNLGQKRSDQFYLKLLVLGKDDALIGRKTNNPKNSSNKEWYLKKNNTKLVLKRLQVVNI